LTPAWNANGVLPGAISVIARKPFTPILGMVAAVSGAHVNPIGPVTEPVKPGAGAGVFGEQPESEIVAVVGLFGFE
jgi:hypothetical protein